MSNHNKTRLGLAAAVALIILQSNTFAMAQQAVALTYTNNLTGAATCRAADRVIFISHFFAMNQAGAGSMHRAACRGFVTVYCN
nr:hypothetical protein [Aquitalea magnusonii]